MLTDKLLNPREQITQESAVRIRIVFPQEAIEIQQRNFSRNITILSENEMNKGYFKDVEEFEDQRNLLGGLLLLKGLDNISSGNEEYSDKLKTYSNGLVWGHSLCEDYYHTNKDFDKFNKELSDKCNVGFKAYSVFDQNALMERSRLLYEIVKVIWEVS